MKIPLRKNWADELRAMEAQKRQLTAQQELICRNLAIDAGAFSEGCTIAMSLSSPEPALIVTPKPEPTSAEADPPAKGKKEQK